jgi:hypothetical protein
MKSINSLFLISVTALWGCTTGYYESFGPKTPYYATAVTRPAVCNDFPVDYRVQVPETDERVRPLDRTQLSSNTNAAFPTHQCSSK